MALNLFKKILGKKEPKKVKAKKGSKKKSKKKTVKKKTSAKKKAKKRPVKKKLTSKKKTSLRKKSKKTKEKELGVVTHYFGKISVGIIKLKAVLRAGDKIQIKGAQVDFSQSVKSMQINHQDVLSAPKNAEVGIKVKKKVRPKDKVYKKL